MIGPVVGIGVGVQYREFKEVIEYRSMSMSPAVVHIEGKYKWGFDFVASAGGMINRFLFASVAYTSHNEILLGFAFAIK
jgi:hypothetical protein